MKQFTIFDSLNEFCKTFDWYYPFSDDHRSYVSGEKEKAKLKDLINKCEKIDLERTKEIVLKYQGNTGICFYAKENIK